MEGEDQDSKFLRSRRTEHRVRAENLAFDIDVRYPPLRDHIYETHFMPLSLAEAQAIVEFHDCTWRRAIPGGALSTKSVLVLDRLQQRVHALLKSHQASFPHGVFLRLCGRSPKDGEPLDRNLPMDLYLQHLNATSQAEVAGCQSPGNAKLVAIGRATPGWLRLTTSQQAMNLLLTSERVFADLID